MMTRGTPESSETSISGFSSESLSEKPGVDWISSDCLGLFQRNSYLNLRKSSLNMAETHDLSTPAPLEARAKSHKSWHKSWPRSAVLHQISRSMLSPGAIFMDPPEIFNVAMENGLFTGLPRFIHLHEVKIWKNDDLLKAKQSCKAIWSRPLSKRSNLKNCLNDTWGCPRYWTGTEAFQKEQKGLASHNFPRDCSWIGSWNHC